MKEINEKFFDQWTEKSAYVFGFIIADGNITKDNRSERWQVQISSKDIQILEDIKEALSSEHAISKDRESFKYSISRQPLAEKLLELGLTPRKSKEGVFPNNIPSEFLSHFIRGYFDGNGHFTYEIHKPGVRRMVSGFTFGTEEFGEGLANALVQLGFKKPTIHKRTRQRVGVIGGETTYYEIRFYQKDTKKLYEIIYSNATILLKRKKENYDLYL